jgi:hypothetical protein
MRKQLDYVVDRVAIQTALLQLDDIGRRDHPVHIVVVDVIAQPTIRWDETLGAQREDDRSRSARQTSTANMRRPEESTRGAMSLWRRGNLRPFILRIGPAIQPDQKSAVAKNCLGTVDNSHAGG